MASTVTVPPEAHGDPASPPSPSLSDTTLQPSITPPSPDIVSTPPEKPEAMIVASPAPNPPPSSKPMKERLKACVPGQECLTCCIGSCSFNVGPCQCPVEGTGFLGIICCTLTMPFACLLGVTWDALDCLTCGCCGCSEERTTYSTSYTTTTTTGYSSGGYSNSYSRTTTTYY